MSFVNSIRSRARREGNPATIILIAVFLACYVGAWITKSPFFVEKFAFSPFALGAHPWSFLTYPFATPGDGTDLVWVLLSALWFYWFGSPVERDLGTQRYVIFFLAMTVLPALFFLIAAFAMGQGVVLFGIMLPVSAITVAWATRNRTAQVLLMMVIPITGLWLGWITALIVLFRYGNGAIPLGIVACLHLIAAWAFASNNIAFLPWGKGAAQKQNLKATERKNKAYFDDVRKREQERQEKERLRQLFERSMIDEAGEDDKRG